MARVMYVRSRSPSGGDSWNAWKVAILGTPGVSHAVQYVIAGTGGSCTWMTSNLFSRKNFRMRSGDAKSASLLSDPFDGMLMMPPIPDMCGSSSFLLDAPRMTTVCPSRRSSRASCTAWCFTPPAASARSYGTTMQMRSLGAPR